VEISGDRELMKLLTFYKCYLSYVRGKVWSFKMDDPLISQNEQGEALHRSRKYFALAQSYVKTHPPILIITTGLMGTGKSTLANALASREGMQVISSDITRKQMAGIPLKKRYYEEFDKGIYSSASSRKTYQLMLDWARNALKQGQSVIIDASFKKRSERKKANNLARKNNAEFLVVECVLDEKNIEKRLKQRITERSISDGRMEILDQQKKDFDRINEFSPENHIVMDTSKSVEQAVNNIVEIIEKGKQ
jgi:hypothetical protein